MPVCRVQAVVDESLCERLRHMKEELGFLKDSEIVRFVIKKGIETVERELLAEKPSYEVV